MKYKHKVLAALAVTVMTIGLAVTASFFSFRHSQEASEARKNTYVVLQGANSFLNALLDAETGQRGYLLTGDKSFLEPYLDGSNSARGLLEKLRQDNLRDTSRVHLDKLALLVDARLADLSNVLELQHSRGMDAAREVVARGEGKRLMDSIRAETDSFIQVEEAALLRQDAEFHSNMRNLFILVVAAILLTLLLAITFAYFIYKKAWIRDGALQSAIFNSTNFSSIATDEKGVIQIFNVGAEHMLGYKAEDVVNKITPADISDPEEVIARATALSLELNTPIKPGFDALVFKASRGIEDIYEQTFIRKDGSRFPAVISVTALHDHLGAIIGYLLIGTDNTARKQVEASHLVLYRSLLDQQLYTRSLIESNIDAIITTDLRGIISDVNQQMQALTGCTREELIGAPFKNYFTDPERAEYAIASALREGKVINYELTAHARDGKETVVSYNANVFLDRERNMQGVLASARDVTDRKRLDQVLQESNVELENAKAIAEKANLAKSEFLSSMSHELRTPLNAVLGFAQLLASSKPPPTPAQKLPIDQILQAGWYLLRLINEILDLAMIESGKVMMSQEPMALADVFQECQAMIEPQAHERGIKITFAPLDIPYHVHADRTRVKQVIINLLSNAIKYNRDGGEVIVQCAMSGKNRVRVSVEDTGIGLAPEQLAQLFQPFNRLGQEAGSEEGSGIGLVVTKQLVELMGGAIGVESNVGVGSVFWVELVLSSAPELKSRNSGETAMVEDDRVSENELPSRRTLLYVEDNPANLLLVEQLIARRSDLKLLTAIDAHLGIRQALAFLPDVILMDINLPGLSGYGALKILLEDPATSHIPIMALSANAVPREIEKGLEAGFFRYLTKPINVVEFMDALDVALKFAAENNMTGENRQG